MSRARKRRSKPNPGQGVPILGFRIPGFCQAFGISEDFYYRLQRDKLGPKTMKMGGVTIISVAAAEIWRREREAATAAAETETATA
jgi:predicted DNA-binding transcriptional regulator AlpA